eukprot:CAMPEP_0197401852 /NCGR_PEP_ID=MMETSP1165-20131217/19113_1 /TAXON_ID=284809 /ORGANISM="Chrysocystis fragilis, Strain CCMP3189" /LENGTH=142 /DNA_ID=CAMNT_0042927975 /DNA_START=40 /DNA_END=466 /DNA_ORIENTATION=-
MPRGASTPGAPGLSLSKASRGSLERGSCDTGGGLLYCPPQHGTSPRRGAGGSFLTQYTPGARVSEAAGRALGSSSWDTWCRSHQARRDRRGTLSAPRRREERASVAAEATDIIEVHSSLDAHRSVAASHPGARQGVHGTWSA